MGRAFEINSLLFMEHSIISKMTTAYQSVNNIHYPVLGTKCTMESYIPYIYYLSKNQDSPKFVNWHVMIK